MSTVCLDYQNSQMGNLLSRPVPALYRTAQESECKTFPNFGAIGTGGLGTDNFFLFRQGGYPFVVVVRSNENPSVPEQSLFSIQMGEIKAGFGRTMSRLPEVFGVSRQTLYNWLSGETPKELHHEKLEQLCEAAKVFRNAGFKPTPAMLDKTLLQGKSLIQLIGSGANGRDVAERLIRSVERGTRSKKMLHDILDGRGPSTLDLIETLAPSLDERV